jgi:hypothetical protein
MNYFERKEKIENLFGHNFYDRFYLSSRILNKYTRSIVHYGDKEAPFLAAEFQNDLGLKGIVKKLGYALYGLFAAGFSGSCKGKGRPILVSASIFQRFNILGGELKDKYNVIAPLNAKNIRILHSARAKSVIKLNNIIYDPRLQKLLAQAANSIKKYIEQPDAAKKDEVFRKLTVLEPVLKERITAAGELFKHLEIGLYLTAFDQNYEDIFNVLACRTAQIPSKCIAHAFLAGDIKDEPKTNCLPVLADKLYVWSQEDYDSLVGYEEMGKIEVGGYPKYAKEYIEQKQKEFPEKNILTLFSEYAPTEPQFMEAEAKLRKELIRIFEGLINGKGITIYVRYHDPVEEKMRKEERALFDKLGIKISRNSFIQDILQSRWCIGLSTSCLYEAKILGKRTYNLLTHTIYDKMFFMKGIECIEAGDLPVAVNGNENGNANPRYEKLMKIKNIISDCL